jgi:hypothetical protein
MFPSTALPPHLVTYESLSFTEVIVYGQLLAGLDYSFNKHSTDRLLTAIGIESNRIKWRSQNSLCSGGGPCPHTGDE